MGMRAFFHGPSGVSPPANSTGTTLLLCGVTVAAVVAALVYLWWRSSKNSIARHTSRDGFDTSLPSPAPSLPYWCGIIGGHTLDVKPSKMAEQTQRWAEEFGGDYELQMFGSRLIVVTGLKDICQMLSLRPSKFKRGYALDQLRWAAEQSDIGPSMVINEGNEWARSRRIVSPHLNGHNVAAVVPIISKIAERLCAKLGAHADAGEVVEVSETLARSAHDIIALAAFGIDINSTSAARDQVCPSFDAMKSNTGLLSSLTMEPLAILAWRTLGSALPWVRRAKAHSRRLRVMTQGAMEAAKRAKGRVTHGISSTKGDVQRTDAPEETSTIGGSLLRSITRGGRGEGVNERTTLSDEEVVTEVNSLFVAGTETTALTICWSMYYLSKHPEAATRCRMEALHVAPLSDGMVSTGGQVSQLQFCSAVFKEALRLKNPAPIQVIQSTGDHTMRTGVKTKKGTSFCLLSRHANTSEAYFSRAAEFVPERWIEAERDEALLGKGAQGSKQRALHTEEALLSFGFGPRICPGQDFAKTEGCAVIAVLCARFDMSVAPGQADPFEEVMHFTYGPDTAKMVFTRRKT